MSLTGKTGLIKQPAGTGSGVSDISTSDPLTGGGSGSVALGFDINGLPDGAPLVGGDEFVIESGGVFEKISATDMATFFSSGGTVTSITAGVGLDGGTITTSGTIDLDIGSLPTTSPGVQPGDEFAFDRAGSQFKVDLETLGLVGIGQYNLESGNTVFAADDIAPQDMFISFTPTSDTAFILESRTVMIDDVTGDSEMYIRTIHGHNFGGVTSVDSVEADATTAGQIPLNPGGSISVYQNITGTTLEYGIRVVNLDNAVSANTKLIVKARTS